MKIPYFILCILGISTCLFSCSTAKTTTKAETYKNLYQEHPLTIAVMPPINKTNNVEAKEFFYLTLSQPLCEKGYYILPPFLCMEMFKTESAYDAEMFINGSLNKFGEILGADAVLFTTITKWEKAAVLATISVEVEYLVRSTKTNEELFYRKGHIQYDASMDLAGGGLLGGLVSLAASAINTAATDHIKVARACNWQVLDDIPAGTYNPNFQKDAATAAGERELKKSVK